MRQEIYEKISGIKKRLEPEGFIIIGVFGSVARGDETVTSDVDVLYELHEPFISRYRGWAVFGRIEAIKKEIEIDLGMEVDLANKDALDEVGKRFILPEVVHVA